MKMPETLPLAAVRPGMQLAEPVLDDIGRVLLPSGCELSDVILSGLARRAVAFLTVIRKAEAPPGLDDEHRMMTVAQLDRLFRKAGAAGEARLLYQSVLEFHMAGRS